MENKYRTVVIIVIVVGFIISYFFWNTSNNELIKRHKLTWCTVYGTDMTNKAGVYLNYYYKVASDSLTGYDKVFLNMDKGSALIGRKFPLAYDSCNAAKSKILISKEDFEEFGLVFPDSLKYLNTN
ncbi:MAG: hypothetical protein ACXVPB_01565 [Bacteroidia bacterium]